VRGNGTDFEGFGGTIREKSDRSKGFQENTPENVDPEDTSLYKKAEPCRNRSCRYLESREPVGGT